MRKKSLGALGLCGKPCTVGGGRCLKPENLDDARWLAAEPVGTLELSGMASDERGRLIERREIYSGKIVDLIVDRIELDGREHIREVIRHPGGVVFLGQLGDGRIPLVEQLRYPMNQPILELPAGKIDPGEDPATGAAREMEEETGWKPSKVQHVLNFYSSPGFCDELLHLYYSDSLEKTAPNREVDEHLAVRLLTIDEAIAQALQGKIQDAKTLVGLFWLKLGMDGS